MPAPQLADPSLPSPKTAPLDFLSTAELIKQIRPLKHQELREQVKLERKRFAILGRTLARELADNHELAAMLAPPPTFP